MTVLTNLVGLFNAVRHLYELELYEDLLLFVELNLPNEPAKIFNRIGEGEELADDQRGFLFCCMADANFQTNQITRAIKNYEMALRYSLIIRQKKLKNHFESVLNSAEIHYRMAKAFLQNRQEEEALRCLEDVPQADQTPKIMFAIVKLGHQLTKPLSQNTRSQLIGRRTPDVPSQRTIKYLKAIVKEVPEAVFCRSFLLSTGNLPSPSFATKRIHSVDDPSLSGSTEFPYFTQEELIWDKVKHFEGQKQFQDALQLLENTESRSLRLLLEQARLHRITGNQQKALNCYQRAHDLDCTNAEGMDAYAAMLGTFGQQQSNARQSQRDLDNLAHNMLQHNPRRAESFTVYGWAARQCHRLQEAKQFEQRAEQLAQARSRQRAEALLLKAQLLADSKRLSKELEIVTAELLYNDHTITPIYALYIQTSIAQKRFTDAKRMAKRALEMVGERNQQISFLYAQALADDGSASGIESAIEILERIIQDGSVSLDPLLLLSRLYEKQQRFEKAIALLNQYKESFGDSRIHRELGDLLSKTNRSRDACAEYEKALNTVMPDSETKDKMINLMGGFQTPQCVVNAAFENDGGIGSTGGGTHQPQRAQPSRAPPPVTRVTRRTSALNNQHEQLRRLRAFYTGVASLTSSSSGGPADGVAARRISTRAAPGAIVSSSSSSPAVISPVVLAPLHFDEDEEEDNEEEGDEVDEDGHMSDDDTPLSNDEDAEEESVNATTGEETSIDGSVERPRGGSTVSLSQHLQHIQQHIQRVQSFLNNGSDSGEAATGEAVATTSTTETTTTINAATTEGQQSQESREVEAMITQWDNSPPVELPTSSGETLNQPIADETLMSIDRGGSNDEPELSDDNLE